MHNGLPAVEGERCVAVFLLRLRFQRFQQATALEALMGWLYLRGEKDRVEELFAVMMGE